MCLGADRFGKVERRRDVRGAINRGLPSCDSTVMSFGLKRLLVSVFKKMFTL